MAQVDTPIWINIDTRNMQYPQKIYYTGFSEGLVRPGETPEEAVIRAKQLALDELSGSVRVIISSNKTLVDESLSVTGIEEQISSKYSSEIKTISQIELASNKVETWYNSNTHTVYAFAYVNKYELIGYYKANILLLLQQAESATETAEQMETLGEKSKARQQCNEALLLVGKIRSMQDLLTALDHTADVSTLKINETELLRNKLTQMQARLVQAVYVFVFGNENLFGISENIILNKVKSDLSHMGCSFVDYAEKADYKLRIDANVRLSSQDEGFVFCYADVEIELFDMHKQKAVFGDEFSEKGGASSKEKAGRKAMSCAAEKIVEKIKPWIDN